MFCSKCGKEIKEGNTFCTYCGQKVEENIKKEKKLSGNKKILIIITVIVMIILIVAGIVIWLNSNGKENVNKENINRNWKKIQINKWKHGWRNNFFIRN